jgi:hypothetical protein
MSNEDGTGTPLDRVGCLVTALTYKRSPPARRTKRRCLLGDPGHTELCTDSQCCLCNIIRNSYDMKHVGFAFGARS